MVLPSPRLKGVHYKHIGFYLNSRHRWNILLAVLWVLCPEQWTLDTDGTSCLQHWQRWLLVDLEERHVTSLRQAWPAMHYSMYHYHCLTTGWHKLRGIFATWLDSVQNRVLKHLFRGRWQNNQVWLRIDKYFLRGKSQVELSSSQGIVTLLVWTEEIYGLV